MFRAEPRRDTEYKTTLDYLARRLRERYPAERVLTLFGTGGGTGDSPGMDEADRENVKAAFNDPASSVRILVATDAASEGLNLHRTARHLLHYDCPMNRLIASVSEQATPSRIRRTTFGAPSA